MGQGAAKAKQGMAKHTQSIHNRFTMEMPYALRMKKTGGSEWHAGGEEAVQKTPEKKDAKKAHKSSDANELIEFMRKNYDAKVKDVTEFDEFYHAIYELIE